MYFALCIIEYMYYIQFLLKYRVFYSDFSFVLYLSCHHTSMPKQEWRISPGNSSYLAVVSSEVEVHSLWGRPVPSAVAGRERDPNNSSTVPSSEPALLVVPFPAHRLLHLALGHTALPGQAQDVGVAAEDRAMLHGGKHPCSSPNSRR